ncbi:MAG: efflux RND transporter periplasmic adaptor subunit, partial [Chitinophagaceae bacterium]|nr:efflux RND transporter periplasmic adaptor subunit [Chitinophagaceae bacterium]
MRVLFLQLCFIAILSASCGANAEKDLIKEPAMAIPVVKLSATDTMIDNEYVADIQASKNVEIRAKVQGFIENIMVDEGQEVKKGQPLFSINNAEFRTECARADAALLNATAEGRAAELELNRIKTLVDKKVISKTEYELADARLKSAEARIAEARSVAESAKIKLSYTYICSPFNGIIDRIPFKPGSLVDEGTLLTTISDLQNMYAYFSVSEGEYLKYLRSKKANKLTGYDDITLVLADGSEFPYRGKVETMESEINRQTGSIAFRATFPNPDKILKHGASGKILLETSMSNALMIPQKAVMEIQDKSFVFVVEKNNKVKMKSFVPKTT